MTMTYKCSWLPTILAGCAWICALAVYILLLFTMPRQPWLWGLCFFLPALLLTGTAILSERHVLHVPGTVFASLILSAAGVIGAFFLLFFLSFDAAVNPVTDPAQYERILSLCGYPEREKVADFPPQIPADAEDVLFSYHTALLQGGEELQLSFSAPPETIARLKISLTEQQGYAEIPDWWVASRDQEDSEMVTLYAKPYRVSDWNHGTISAAFFRGNTVFFCMEDW
ncbi:MAG: hypothetical protein ACOX6P_08420 [Candidatus Merdivicinus sp.]|jgi:hypothetical protein